MPVIKAKLFGIPTVMKDNEQINFPYRKAEALFYYLLVKKQASRDTLVNLLWSDTSEKSAKKNLRNAIYIIRKTIDEEVLISPKRTIIKLNDDINYIIDIDIFLNAKDNDFIEIYKGEFLEGFYAKDANNFEQWKSEIRNYYRDIYINKLHKIVDLKIKKNQLKCAEEFCNKIIKYDEFDELAYRKAMKIYRKKGKYNKCIDIYNQLVNILNNELSISPDEKTVKLFEDIFKERVNNQFKTEKGKRDFFYGREKETKELNNSYIRLIKGIKQKKAIIIQGEMGVGKSKLVDKFLNSIKDSNIQTMITYCYHAEEEFLLKPWNDIFRQLSEILHHDNIKINRHIAKIIANVFPSFANEEILNNLDDLNDVDNFKYHILEYAIEDVFKLILNNKKLIIVFEDIQWIDDMTLLLLKDILLNINTNSLMIIATCRNGYGKNVENFLAELGKKNQLHKCILKRFTKDESIQFSKDMLPNYKFTNELLSDIYSETLGNTLFLIEYLNTLKQNSKNKIWSSKLHDILNSKFYNISKESEKILNICSVFFDKFTFEEIQQISGKSDIEIVDIIEELKDRYIIKELLNSDDLEYAFVHQKYREFIYLKMSLSKRRVLHNKIGKFFEMKLRNDNRDVVLFSKLIYHFDKAMNKIDTLKYTIKNLSVYLNFNHEIFPLLFEDINVIENRYFYLNQNKTTKELMKIEELVNSIKNQKGEFEELDLYEIQYLHLVGRHCIKEGNYDKGILSINNMIDKSLKYDLIDYVLKGYRTIIYYCINIHDIKKMGIYIEKALQLALNNNIETAILYRLKGFQKILEGNNKEGEELLYKCIRMFELLENTNKYSPNIAGAYNYLGESKMYTGDFEKSILYLNKSIYICKEKSLIRGLAVVYTNLGQVYYALGEYSKSEVYLNKAIDIYQDCDLLWKRSMANGFLALIYIKKELLNKSCDFLKKANSFASKSNNPQEKVINLLIKMIISKYMKDSNEIHIIFKDIITLPCQKYLEDAEQLLDYVSCNNIIRIIANK